MKLNPQSDIHLKCSSGVVPREFAGLGEKKSSRLKPFHRGRTFLGGVTIASDTPTVGVVDVAPATAFDTNAEDVAVAATVVAVVRIKSLLFICLNTLSD